jgi:alkylated DNA nucleotide flippase Atl1
MKTTSASTRDNNNDALKEQMRLIVCAIPAGRVLAYGQVGAKCEPPLSGYICGRILHLALEDVPWWRVVAKDGHLPIGKRGAEMARKQRDLLVNEGVAFDENGCVAAQCFSES